MITVRVYDDQNLIDLQVLNTEDLEGGEFSKKFRANSSGDTEKLMGFILKTLNSKKNQIFKYSMMISLLGQGKRQGLIQSKR